MNAPRWFYPVIAASAVLASLSLAREALRPTAPRFVPVSIIPETQTALVYDFKTQTTCVAFAAAALATLKEDYRALRCGNAASSGERP